MSLFTWCTRRCGGLAMLAALALSYWVPHPSVAHTAEGAGLWTVIFAYYCLFIHVLVAAFPLRSCWAMWDLTRSLKRAAHSKALQSLKFAHRRRGSSTSLSSSETLTSSHGSSASSEAGDLEPELYTDGDAEPDSVVHAIVIPNYKEELDTLRETLEVLGCHPQARNSYDVYLAMESRENNVELKAMGLVQEFIKKFRSIDFTIHPSDIPGESAGKGSNMAWAVRKLSEKYSMEARKDVIVTGIDADSHLSSNYFAHLTSMHLSYPETAKTTMYAAPIIFDRNSHSVTALVRVGDILWASAGMSGLYRGSTIAPPTSVYSVPLELVDRVGGWDCDPEAIGEDLHMYLKCFFALNGNLTVRTIVSPVSQSNVTGGAGGGLKGMVADIKARYKQAIRHMWGALDSGYAIRKVVELWQERKHTSRAACRERYLLDVTHDTLKGPNWERIIYLFHRLFEAHFLPLQTTILIIASTLYVWATEGKPDVHGINWIFDACNVLRTAGFMEIAFLLFLYESFHRICVQTREKEMSDAGLAKGMNFSHRHVSKNWKDYCMVPIVAPLFGAVPCAQAQVCHFWTLDLVYTVSKKVTRQRSRSMAAATLA
ncbi:hypothetical protein INS49_010362 [Diaporthe citri]|uniref:uncharacterized protein n=1 Tax=Diaporthe citri TaxID=83186 RepID=UPI001C827EAA|nr:uncharacterized protein INS49_010362 [Diaporthe citri]KAG6362133.1 hypothetical protein INS49_010362 [Diaporthe citri]